MSDFSLKKFAPFLIAIVIALLGMTYYILSGRSNLDQNVRALKTSDQVKKTSTGENNSMVIDCANGESYEIVYPKGQTNFEDLVYNKCGAEGVKKN
jgi:hypothetical protein